MVIADKNQTISIQEKDRRSSGGRFEGIGGLGVLHTSLDPFQATMIRQPRQLFFVTFTDEHTLDGGRLGDKVDQVEILHVPFFIRSPADTSIERCSWDQLSPNLQARRSPVSNPSMKMTSPIDGSFSSSSRSAQVLSLSASPVV